MIINYNKRIVPIIIIYIIIYTCTRSRRNREEFAAADSHFFFSLCEAIQCALHVLPTIIIKKRIKIYMY